jgi:sugar-specific transcriptional regulator TrmB
MLPKLEKMGLITKTVDMPFMVNAVPIETGLNDLLAMCKQKSEENITSLESNVKELIAQVESKPNWEQETKLSLLTTDKAIKNREDLSFKNTKSNISLILTEDTLNTPLIRYVCENLRALANNGIKIKLIIEAIEDEDLLRTTIEKIKSNNNDNITAKLSRDIKTKNYQICDSRELSIATQQKTDSDFPCILWTNDINIIQVYEKDFAKTWEEAELIDFADNKALQLASA